MKYKGLPINEGIVIGRIRKVSAVKPGPEQPGGLDADNERMRFFDALLEYEGRMKSLASDTPSVEGRDIIAGQIMIARDPALSDETIRLIDKGMSADEAFSSACKKYEDMLDSIDDDYIFERAEDLLEVRNGILALMGGAGLISDENDNSDADVIFADKLSAAETVGLRGLGVKAVVMRRGTSTSHIAVILRSLGIVSVFGVDIEPGEEEGREVIVDGGEGIVITDPSDDEKKEYSGRKKTSDENAYSADPDEERHCTSDGKEIGLLCNIGSEWVPDIAAYSDGAGLVRTEFLFMAGGEAPSEERQAEIYAGIADRFSGKEIVIRTLDAGGDKEMPDSGTEDAGEENPALGVRGIRLSLRNREAFSHQICAILRASYKRNISILIPMVTSVDEVIRVKRIVEGCRSLLRGKGIPYSADVKLGCMIETPAAVLCAGEIAKECDFFSIGTNDLAQYIMCADRANSGMAEYCSIYQPSVIRAVRIVCDKASGAGIPVTVCGEAASDPAMLPVFLGLGVSSLSVDPSRLAGIKKALQKQKMEECKKLALKVLNAYSITDVREILTR
jgi:phosphotransferase system enzyme I (PtsI)